MTIRPTLYALLSFLLFVAPAGAEPIEELQPFSDPDTPISGTATGEGAYEGVTIGQGEDQITVKRLSVSMDGNLLTDLSMQDVVLPPGDDGVSGTIDRIIVENSAIPLNLDEENPEEVFDWLLNLNADRLAIEGLSMSDGDWSFEVKTLAAENVVDGYFSALRLNGLTASGTDEGGNAIDVELDRVSVRGVGLAWMLFARASALDQFGDDAKDQPLGGDAFEFLDAFDLADYADQLRLQGIDMTGVQVSANGAEVFELEAYETRVTDYSGDMPAAGNYAVNGTFNVETIQALAADDPQVQLGLQAFQALYGGATVAFSSTGEQLWYEDDEVTTVEATLLELDRLLRIDLDLAFTDYDPAATIIALNDQDDDITLASISKDAAIEELSVRVSDLGALELGFSLAPPGIERQKIANQAAQFAGIGVVQAMQFGISLSGSVAEVVSGFISKGGTIEVRQEEGTSLPWAPIQAMTTDADNPETQQKVMDNLKNLKLEIVGSE